VATSRVHTDIAVRYRLLRWRRRHHVRRVPTPLWTPALVVSRRVVLKQYRDIALMYCTSRCTAPMPHSEVRRMRDRGWGSVTTYSWITNVIRCVSLGWLPPHSIRCRRRHPGRYDRSLRLVDAGLKSNAAVHYMTRSNGGWSQWVARSRIVNRRSYFACHGDRPRRGPRNLHG
jgi:hypothetical protein